MCCCNCSAHGAMQRAYACALKEAENAATRACSAARAAEKASRNAERLACAAREAAQTAENAACAAKRAAECAEAALEKVREMACEFSNCNGCRCPLTSASYSDCCSSCN